MSESQVRNENEMQNELAQTQQKLQEAQTQKEQMAQELEQVRREQSLKEKLLAAGAIDTETAMLVVQSRLSQNNQANIDKVIEQLRKEKLHLFEVVSMPAFAATRGTKDKTSAGREKLKTAAAKAMKTAGRTELMEYMKARRGR